MTLVSSASKLWVPKICVYMGNSSVSLWLALWLDIYRNQNTYFRIKRKGRGVHEHLQPRRWQGSGAEQTSLDATRGVCTCAQWAGVRKIPTEGEMFLSEMWNSGVLIPCKQWKCFYMRFLLLLPPFLFLLQILHWNLSFNLIGTF